MQTNLFTQEQINRESGIGEFHQSREAESNEANKDPQKTLSYPGSAELLEQVTQLLQENKRVVFKCSAVHQASSLEEEDFLNSPLDASQQASPISLFAGLATQNITGQKVLGQFSMAYIEAKATQYYNEKLGRNDIDHFSCAQGIVNSSVLEDIIKAHAISLNDISTILMPANAFKAYRRSAMSGWQNLETDKANMVHGHFSDLHRVDKFGQSSGELKLDYERTRQLFSPIYKLKLGDGWTVVVPWHADFEALNQTVQLEINPSIIEALNHNLNYDESSVQDCETKELECSLGQASRVIFTILGASYENLPELMMNHEGGSWSSIAMESSSSGRFNGTNSMHEVLKNGWHRNEAVSIPWNYLGFDRLTYSNMYLLEDADIHYVCFDKNEHKPLVDRLCFVECPQNWKKVSTELIQFVVRFAYREYSTLGNKQYLYSSKELMLIAAKYLANWKHGNDAELAKEICPQTDLLEYLEILAMAHEVSDARADFYSSKLNPSNLSRLKNIALIYKSLEKQKNANSKTFSNKIYELLSKDIKSEGITSWDLYQRIKEAN